MTALDEMRIRLGGSRDLDIYVTVFDNSLARKWLAALNHLLQNNYHLEKNYCFMGFPQNQRDGDYILQQVNHSIQAINAAGLGYHIHDHFDMDTMFSHDPRPRTLQQHRMNCLHRYFEDLQGMSGALSPYYQRASAQTRWHIRQLNLLCHEFESWALSWRKMIEAPDWVRPSQLMCWLNAPRFALDQEDLELFGIDTISRPQGGVFVGVNKAVGKHHWEVFHDEGRDSRISELTTTAMRGQTEAAGDFDIEWGRDPSGESWQRQELAEFRAWLRDNGFDPDDKSLTIGHPQVAQVDLMRTFGTLDHHDIWRQLSGSLDVISIHTSEAQAEYDYHWSDSDYADVQQRVIGNQK